MILDVADNWTHAWVIPLLAVIVVSLILLGLCGLILWITDKGDHNPPGWLDGTLIGGVLLGAFGFVMAVATGVVLSLISYGTESDNIAKALTGAGYSNVDLSGGRGTWEFVAENADGEYVQGGVAKLNGEYHLVILGED